MLIIYNCIILFFFNNIYDFYNFGVEEVFPVSAIHGIGIGDILDKIVSLLPVKKEKTMATNPVEDFTPPPMSKKPTGNDIASLWQALLMNIKNPSTTALLKLATPLRIADDGIVITIKNERLVAQMNEVNKKQLVIDAAKVVFNGASVPVTIRLAQSGDAKVEIKQAPQPAQVQEQKPEPQPRVGKVVETSVNSDDDVQVFSQK